MPTVRGKVLIDTCILIYATLHEDPRFSRAQDVLLGAGEDGLERYVSAQSLAEMYPNLTGPKTEPPDTPDQAREKIQAIGSLPGLCVLPVTFEIVRTALVLCRSYRVRRQVYFDMQLVGTMQVFGIPTLITENTAEFEAVREIRTWNPFEDSGGER